MLKNFSFEIEPIIWFILSAILIFIGAWMFKENNVPFASLFSALGGAGITRVRSPNKTVITNSDKK